MIVLAMVFCIAAALILLLKKSHLKEEAGMEMTAVENRNKDIKRITETEEITEEITEEMPVQLARPFLKNGCLKQPKAGPGFFVEQDITYIHTDTEAE